MRPSVTIPESDQYECPTCGTRVEAPEGRACPECDGTLRNLAHSRDL